MNIFKKFAIWLDSYIEPRTNSSIMAGFHTRIAENISLVHISDGSNNRNRDTTACFLTTTTAVYWKLTTDPSLVHILNLGIVLELIGYTLYYILQYFLVRSWYEILPSVSVIWIRKDASTYGTFLRYTHLEQGFQHQATSK